jgi:two-component system sensor histidine kinase AlgZ
MKKTPPAVDDIQIEDCYLPDFCHAENLLKLVLVLELVAIVLTLAGAPKSGNLFVELALLSMFVQWIGLGSAGILCLLRRYGLLHGAFRATLLSLGVVALVTLLISGIGWMLEQQLRFGYFRHQSLFATLLQHLAIALILYGMTLRYFFVQHRNQQTLKAESRARFQALQARIRPHFLFNSLNTIANLTYEDPDRAEEAIEDLSDLFRASLRADNQVSLEREIELTRQYIALEALRLDDRLQVKWLIKARVERFSLPALTLQPLVENAIYHGIEPLPEGGEVRIELRQTGDQLIVRISNPLPPARSPNRAGNRMALENIRERLDLAFDGRAKIEHLEENGLYTVSIRVPLMAAEMKDSSRQVQ